MSRDVELLDTFFQTATSLLQDTVTHALRLGRTVDQLALVLEQQFDGRVTVAIGSREMWSLIEDYATLPAEARAQIIDAIAKVRAGEIPVVVFVHREGYVAGGVRRMRGKLDAVF